MVCRHAHQVKPRICQGTGIIRAANKLVGPNTPRVCDFVAHGGVKRAYGNICLGDDLAHLLVRIIRVVQRIQGSLNAAGGYDDPRKEQCGDWWFGGCLCDRG